MNVPEIADKINDLYGAIRQTSNSPSEIAGKINSILLHGDGVPSNLVEAAWTHFAKQKGVKK